MEHEKFTLNESDKHSSIIKKNLYFNHSNSFQESSSKLVNTKKLYWYEILKMYAIYILSRLNLHGC